MQKKVTKAFGKKIYLLGKDKDGYTVWMEAPSWECNWYWGFGYIERYTNKLNPQNAKDIISHTHWNTEIVKHHEGTYITHINENPDFKKTTLTENESWTLSELMKTAYTLQETAKLYHTGGANITKNPLKKILKNKKRENHINHTILPLIFKEIDKLLSPKTETTK